MDEKQQRRHEELEKLRDSIKRLKFLLAKGRKQVEELEASIIGFDTALRRFELEVDEGEASSAPSDERIQP